MCGRAYRNVAVLSLFVCLVCPLMETFDYWDHTEQTGNDTEYAFVVLALCVGVAYSFVRVTFKSELLAFVTTRLVATDLKFSFVPGRVVSLLLDGTGPPPVPLRI